MIALDVFVYRNRLQSLSSQEDERLFFVFINEVRP